MQHPGRRWAEGQKYFPSLRYEEERWLLHMSLRCTYSQSMAGMSSPVGFVAIMLLATFVLFQPLERNEWVLFLLFVYKLFIIFCFITQRRKGKEWRWTVTVFLPHTWSTGVKSILLPSTLAVDRDAPARPLVAREVYCLCCVWCI